MPKRAASPKSTSNPSKKARTGIKLEANAVLGEGQWQDWPAPQDQMRNARAFIRECAEKQRLTILVPDKDADGLSSCMILYKTLLQLGLSDDLIKVHLLQKGTSIFSAVEQTRLEQIIVDNLSEATTSSDTREARIIVVDQGSRPGPPLARQSAINANLRTLIIDHHMSDSWPEESQVLSACHSPPISTSSLLTYLTCRTLHPKLSEETGWYCLLGVFGDLGPSEIDWGNPSKEWPASAEMIELGQISKSMGKKSLNAAVSAINAPRRTAEYNVIDAWKVLFKANDPDEIGRSNVLQDARDKVNREVERCTHTAPKFSKDGRVALLRIDSGYQVHPVIATRWSGTLNNAKNLQMIMVENPGHNPDPHITSFSCRLKSQLRKLPENERPNLIELLKEYGHLTGDGFMERVGEDFARGHKEATGGIIQKADFELFAEKGMEIGVKDPNAPPTKRQKKEQAVQKNTLSSYFSISPKKEEVVKVE